MTARPSFGFDAIADRYEASRGGEQRAVELAAAMAPWLAPAARLLDCGGGTGVVGAALGALGFDPVIRDVSHGMLRQAAIRFPGRTVRADAAAVPFGDGSFDAVTFVWVLHHVGDPAAALAEAARVVRPRGRVVAISGVPSAGGDELERVFRRLDVLRADRIDTAEVLVGLAGAAGLRHVSQGAVEIRFEQSPFDLVDRIEGRLFAPLWDVDEATWARCVSPVVEALRRLPEPGRRRRRCNRHDLLVFER